MKDFYSYWVHTCTIRALVFILFSLLSGALMFVAWMTTVNIGVIVARFFKPIWSRSLWFGEEIWFQVGKKKENMF